MARSYRQGEWIPGWEQSSNLDGGSAYSVSDCQKIWVSWNNLIFPFTTHTVYLYVTVRAFDHIYMEKARYKFLIIIIIT